MATFKLLLALTPAACSDWGEGGGATAKTPPPPRGTLTTEL
jgi:hypothetical protein